MSGSEEAAKAAEVLDEGTESASSDASGDAFASDEETATGGTEQGPTGIDRLIRTDKPLNLDDSTEFWDPDGKGGLNRIGAAAKQAFGADNWPPAVHLMIGAAESMYTFVTESGLLPTGGNDD